jgi:predicted glycoside hydrolase/deacetylase ChbG (UPF0249 family)
MIQLILNADDFGLTQGVNEAVFELARLGALNSTTVMVNMPYAGEARELLFIEGFKVGLHFTLTEGKPIAPLERVSSLVNKNGLFFSFEEFRQYVKSGHIKESEIALELDAQWQRLCAILGQTAAHIDSHQNIHKQPIVIRALMNFALTHPGLGVRNPHRFVFDTNKDNARITPSWRNSLRCGNLRRFFTDLYLWHVGSRLKKGFHGPDGELHAANFKKLDLLNVIAAGKFPFSTGQGCYEVACHPATTTKGLGNDKLKEKRVKEYECLKVGDRFSVIGGRWSVVGGR